MHPGDRGITLFDLDKTLYRGTDGYVILDFARFLAQCDLLDSDHYEELQQILRKYAEGRLARTPFARSAIAAYYAGLSGKQG
jgi:hypothetical protein